MSFTVPTLQDREIYKRVVQDIDLTVGEDDIAQAWEYHHAQSRFAIALTNDKVDPDQFLDGLFDVMGKRIDPYLDEVLLGLEQLTNHG